MSFDFKNKVFLAPLAGVTDASFRLICREHGADMACTEMISANGIKYGNVKTKEMLFSFPGETEKGVQFFGPDAETLLYCVEFIKNTRDIAYVDINMGCPVSKIVKNGEGSSLMKDPLKAEKIVFALKKELKVPLTVKFRRGIDAGHENAVDFAKAIENGGADAITVHGRYASQFYEGVSDINTIAKVKRAVKIPVIGNGDVCDYKSAKRLLNETGCDSVMIGRASLGNPFVFDEIKAGFENREYIQPSTETKLKTLLKQAELCCIDKGEQIGIKQMRKHAAWYIKGMKYSSRFKDILLKINTLDELKNNLELIMSYER